MVALKAPHYLPQQSRASSLACQAETSGRVCGGPDGACSKDCEARRTRNSCGYWRRS